MTEIMTLDKIQDSTTAVYLNLKRKKKTYVRIFIAVLFIVVKNWKLPNGHCIPQQQNSFFFQRFK